MSTPSVRRTGRSWAIPVAVLAVLALLIALVINLNGDPESPAPGAGSAATAPAEGSADAAPTEVQGAVQPDLSDIERRDEADPLAAGPVDAPVTLVVFSDYQCPFCAQWSQDTLPVMMERADAGELRIEWRDVNVFGDASTRAAKAAYAAALQGSYWEYHHALYPDGETRDDLSEESLVGLAEEMGLDTEQFAADMSSEETQSEISRNAKLGLDIGAHSTPAFVLGGQPIVGAQPTEVFVDAFESALAQGQ
ncbi:DsbA family protein [Ornithinimicrobium murale]|uniref:DsbA family protein n=1 Tax=Ornithinimicrobium murale TaxID=1050153 RepID=UPI000E0DE538|nr:thioredoxin domain-containing protein [Ornithinimicrobium murale]